MTVQACLKLHIGRLVHPSAEGTPVAAVRHLFFIAGCIAVTSLALAAAPLYLAMGLVPACHDALMLSWLVLPLIAAAHVSHTGDLATGEVLTAATWMGLAWTGLAGGSCGTGIAAALLLLVVLEVGISTGSRASGLLATSAIGSLAVLAVLAATGHIASDPGRADAVLIGLALVQAGILVLRGRAATQASESAAQDDAQRYRVLSDAIGDLVLRFDQSGHGLAANGASERLFGVASADLLGRGFFERVHVADRPAFLQAVNKTAMERDSVTVNLRFRMASVASATGPYTEPVFAWIELRTRQIDAASPTNVAVVAAVRNITDRVQHEAETERAKRQAEQANAAKDRFIATVSHELRTPLNAIIGFAEMLASPTLAPQDAAKQRDYAEIIRTSGHHLLAVVNSLLDLSKLDAGKFELCCEPFDLTSLVDTCCEMISLKVEEAQVDLRRDIASGLEPLVGDRRACKQILLNLLSNALKFTRPGGRVTVAVRPDGNAVLLSVSDTGIGMAARDLARLGDPFFQARNDYDRPYEGTGLGLSVVKGLVGLHGGTIAVDSAPGEGTAVTVRLPLDGRRPQQPPSAKIEVITRYPRTGGLHVPADQKVQKIA